MQKRLDFSLGLIVLVISILLRVSIIAPSSFDGLYGQDAYAYYNFAADVLNGDATGEFFWPLGYPALLTLGMGVFGVDARVGQALSILMGAALAPLIYLLARQMSGKPAGAFVAGLVMAFCGQAVQSSIVLMADIPSLFGATLSAVMLWLYLRGGRSSWLMLSAFALALAGISRWLYLILALPWALTVLIYWRGRIRWKESLLTATAALIILMPQALYSRSSPFPVLNHAWVEGWSSVNFGKHQFTNIDGNFTYETPNALFYAQPFYDPYYVAPIFIPFIFLGLLWSLKKRRWMALVMLLGWVALPFIFLAGIPYQNIRFPMIFVPAIAFFIGSGIDGLVTWTQHFRPLKKRILQRTVAVGLSVIVIFGVGQMFITSQNIVSNFVTVHQRDKAVAAWATEIVPAEEILYTFGLTLTLQHYTSLDVYEIYYETPASLAEKWQRVEEDYLLLNVWNIENQWAGREPQIAYHWLRDERGLVEMGRLGNYTLFRVNR